MIHIWFVCSSQDLCEMDWPTVPRIGEAIDLEIGGEKKTFEVSDVIWNPDLSNTGKTVEVDLIELGAQ